MKKRLGKILCFAVACMMAASGCSGNAEESGETVPVQSVSILAGLGGGLQNRYAGKVVSQETLELKKEENKTIKEVFVQAGDEVKAGQKLFAYDSDEISLSIDQAKLELEKLENSITTMEKMCIRDRMSSMQLRAEASRACREICRSMSRSGWKAWMTRIP